LLKLISNEGLLKPKVKIKKNWWLKVTITKKSDQQDYVIKGKRNIGQA